MFRSSCAGGGGKGVATSLGVALAISPLAGAVRVRAYVVAYVASRISSVGLLLGSGRPGVRGRCWVACRGVLFLSSGGGRGDGAAPRESGQVVARGREAGLADSRLARFQGNTALNTSVSANPNATPADAVPS